MTSLLSIILLFILATLVTSQRKVALNTIVSISASPNQNSQFYLDVPARSRVVTSALLNETDANLITILVAEDKVSEEEFDFVMGQRKFSYQLGLTIEPSLRSRRIFFLTQYQTANQPVLSFTFQSTSSLVTPVDSDFGDMVVTLDASNLNTYYQYTTTCDGSYHLTASSENTVQVGWSFSDYTDSSVSPIVSTDIDQDITSTKPTKYIYISAMNLDATCTPGVDCSPVKINLTEKCGAAYSAIGLIVGLSVSLGCLLLLILVLLIVGSLVLYKRMSRSSTKHSGYQTTIPDVPVVILKTEGLEDDLYSIGHKAYSDV
ncbi:NADPH-dependent aldehyde reductase [Acrasis kona]|uniref:NADPH-dependent aldehyde reductase n=1 Tax=Acrasis kona TaxID=1008807 RepID=A0AAW2ZME5_9EUKA